MKSFIHNLPLSGSAKLRRKFLSFLSLTREMGNTLLARFWFFLSPNIHIGRSCTFGRAVKLKATDGGSISIGEGCHLHDYVQITAFQGNVKIGSNSSIGVGVVIVGRCEITVGKDALIAEYVVLRDQDHDIGKRPLRLASFKSAPLVIGDDVWIGCKASVLRGGSVGSHSVIGAHALVRSAIPDAVVAVGTPAKVVKHL